MVKNSKISGNRNSIANKKKTTGKKADTKKTGVKKTTGKKNTKRKKTIRKKKKNLFPSILLIGGIFFLSVILIIAVIMNLKVNKLKEQQEVKKIKHQTQTEIINGNFIDKEIKSVLFDFNITKKNILEHSVNNYSKSFFIEYKIQIKKNLIGKLKNRLYEDLKKYNFQLEDKGNKVYFYKKRSQITIEFLSKKKIKTSNTVVDKKPKMAIILDDAGRDLDTLHRILKLKYPITIATIPYTSHDIESVKLIKRAGKTAFLHQPGEPKSYPEDDPGKGAIFINTPPDLVKLTIRKNFERLKGVDGFNNHMGSALTEDRKKMLQVLRAAKPYTNIFVDSKTSPYTVAYEVCLEMNLRCGQNKKFIDNELDHNYIKNKLDESADYAKKHGKIIIIGHLKPDTVDVLLEYLSEIEKKGVKIVDIKEVLD